LAALSLLFALLLLFSDEAVLDEEGSLLWVHQLLEIIVAPVSGQEVL